MYQQIDWAPVLEIIISVFSILICHNIALISGTSSHGPMKGAEEHTHRHTLHPMSRGIGHDPDSRTGRRMERREAMREGMVRMAIGGRVKLWRSMTGGYDCHINSTLIELCL